MHLSAGAKRQDISEKIHRQLHQDPVILPVHHGNIAHIDDDKVGGKRVDIREPVSGENQLVAVEIQLARQVSRAVHQQVVGVVIYVGQATEATVVDQADVVREEVLDGG